MYEYKFVEIELKQGFQKSESKETIGKLYKITQKRDGD